MKHAKTCSRTKRGATCFLTRTDHLDDHEAPLAIVPNERDECLLCVGMLLCECLCVTKCLDARTFDDPVTHGFFLNTNSIALSDDKR
jgi:hypothetical protein